MLELRGGEDVGVSWVGGRVASDDRGNDKRHEAQCVSRGHETGLLVCRRPGERSVYVTRRSPVALRRRLSTGFAFVATPFEASDPAELLARLSLPGKDIVSSSARRTDYMNFGRLVSSK